MTKKKLTSFNFSVSIVHANKAKIGVPRKKTTIWYSFVFAFHHNIGPGWLNESGSWFT